MTATRPAFTRNQVDIAIRDLSLVQVTLLAEIERNNRSDRRVARPTRDALIRKGIIEKSVTGALVLTTLGELVATRIVELQDRNAQQLDEQNAQAEAAVEASEPGEGLAAITAYLNEQGLAAGVEGDRVEVYAANPNELHEALVGQDWHATALYLKGVAVPGIFVLVPLEVQDGPSVAEHVQDGGSFDELTDDALEAGLDAASTWVANAVRARRTADGVIYADTRDRIQAELARRQGPANPVDEAFAKQDVPVGGHLKLADVRPGDVISEIDDEPVIPETVVEAADHIYGDHGPQAVRIAGPRSTARFIPVDYSTKHVFVERDLPKLSPRAPREDWITSTFTSKVWASEDGRYEAFAQFRSLYADGPTYRLALDGHIIDGSYRTPHEVRLAILRREFLGNR